MTIKPLTLARFITIMTLGAGVSSAYAMLPNPTDQNNQPIAGSVPSTATNAVQPSVATPAQSASAPRQATRVPVQSAVYAYVVQADGLVPVSAGTELRSGDVVEYHGYFSNVSEDRIRSMTVTMSIPENMEFLGDQSPGLALGSVDGVRFSRMPLRANMNGVVQNVPLNMYKGLRWNVEDVGLKGVVVVKYRARVK